MRFRRPVLRALSISACMATVALGLNATPASAAVIQASGPIVSYVQSAPHKCVDVSGGSTADLAVVDLYDCNDSPAQHWQIMSDGTIQIFGKSLDVAGGAPVNPTKVQL